MREIKLRNIDDVLSEIEYPVTRESLLAECGDVTLILAEGTEEVGDVLAQSETESFDSVDDVRNEVMNFLPRHSVGEPFQSEGDA